MKIYPVDHLCEFKGTILSDDSGVYSCTLNQTDISTNKNKFYIMQIVTSGTEYHLHIRYGRIGENGTILSDTFSNKSSAVIKFEKQFKAKTGNSWGCDTFIKKTGKYFKTEIQYEVNDNEIKPIKKKVVEESKLDDRVKFLMELFTNKKTMENTLISLSINPKKMPLGKISKTQLKGAQQTLNEIRKLLDEKTKSSKKISSDSDSESEGSDDSDSDDDVIDFSSDGSESESESDDETTQNKILELSSQFYTYIPYSCGRKKPPIIDNDETLGDFVELLDELKNLEVAVKVTKMGGDNMDSIYDSLGADIIPVDKDSKTWEIISDYVTNTHGSTHNFKVKLIDVYEINRTSENPEIKKTLKKIGNRHLLWHGSRMTNFCSIIKNGLVLNPESLGVYITGKMFGYGVYTASAFSKSFNYCDSGTSNDFAALLLCDVALGTQAKRLGADYYITKEKLLKEKCHSTWGMGKNTPLSSVKIDKDITVPNGKLGNSGINGTLLYDEYIVYDTNQISLKYLVIVKKC